MSDPSPDVPGVDGTSPEQKAEELIADAKEAKRELDEQQSKALEQIAAGDDVQESYETVQLGELELDVLGWLPGDIEDLVIDAGQYAEQGDPEAIRKSKETIIAALDEMTVGDEFSPRFWRQYHGRYGQEGLIIAADAILGPALANAEETREGLDSFRGDGPGDGFRDGVQYDGPPSE